MTSVKNRHRGPRYTAPPGIGRFVMRRSVSGLKRPHPGGSIGIVSIIGAIVVIVVVLKVLGLW